MGRSNELRSPLIRPGDDARSQPFTDMAPPYQENRAAHLETVYRLTERLYRASDVVSVLEAAMDAIIDGLGCAMCSIALTDSGGAMRCAAWRGLSDHYRHMLDGYVPWTSGANAPAPVFVTDTGTADDSNVLMATIRNEGIRSLALIPIMSQGRISGMFTACYPASHHVSEVSKALAVTIARQLGLGIERAQDEHARISTLRDLQDSEQRFRTMAEQAPVMIWMSDAQGNCLHLNEMLRRFWGIDEAGVARFNWQSTVHPDDRDYVSARMTVATERRERVSVVARYRNGSGDFRILETLAHPCFAADGTFMGLTGVNTDVTEREYAVKALRDSEERLRLVVEAAPSGMVMTDGDGRILMVNALCERLFGYERGELLGRPIEVLVPPDIRARHPALRRSHMRSAPSHMLIREVVGHHRDGRNIPLEIGVNPINTREGMRVIATVSDIAERKQAEGQREMLLAELNHRVKNTLSVVQGIAYQTFRQSDKAAREAFEGRLLALARAHDLLTRAHWESTSLRQIAVETLQIDKPDGQRITAEGPLVNLNPHTALTIALALHELFTNALKYGALSQDTGCVNLSWRPEQDACRLRIEWRERGGPPVRPPAHRGFGSLLLEHTLARDLDGRVEMSFEPAGAVCIIEMPLSDAGGTACLG